jgi:hypothetical protein
MKAEESRVLDGNDVGDKKTGERSKEEPGRGSGVLDEED